MKLHPTIRCESSLSFGADVCALQYLANGKLLIVILSDGSVVFINSFLTGNQQRPRVSFSFILLESKLISLILEAYE